MLREHCEREGRDYDDIEKTVMLRARPGRERREDRRACSSSCKGSPELGISHAHGIVPDVWKLTPLTMLGREVVPAIADW